MINLQAIAFKSPPRVQRSTSWEDTGNEYDIPAAGLFSLTHFTLFVHFGASIEARSAHHLFLDPPMGVGSV